MALLETGSGSELSEIYDGSAAEAATAALVNLSSGSDRLRTQVASAKSILRLLVALLDPNTAGVGAAR